MYALADCNNFFASCERVFRPDLYGKPVIVLSNNDGCAVARSNEAKALGIKMGDPYFKIRDIIERNHVAVFSSNFALYGDMSRRVQEVLRSFAPAVEQYSIDEAFLDLTGMAALAGSTRPSRFPWASPRQRRSRRSPRNCASSTPSFRAGATCTARRTLKKCSENSQRRMSGASAAGR